MFRNSSADEEMRFSVFVYADDERAEFGLNQSVASSLSTPDAGPKNLPMSFPAQGDQSQTIYSEYAQGRRASAVLYTRIGRVMFFYQANVLLDGGPKTPVEALEYQVQFLPTEEEIDAAIATNDLLALLPELNEMQPGTLLAGESFSTPEA